MAPSVWSLESLPAEGSPGAAVRHKAREMPLRLCSLPDAPWR